MFYSKSWEMTIAVTLLLFVASTIVSSAKISVIPTQANAYSEACTDFYEYACREPVHELQQANQATFQHIAQDFNERLIQTALTNLTALNSTTSNAIKFLVDLHQECQKEKKIDNDSLLDLLAENVLQDNSKSAFQMLKDDYELLTGMPASMIFADAASDELLESGMNLTEWADLYATYYSMTGEGATLYVDMFSDWQNRTLKRLIFDKSHDNPSISNILQFENLKEKIIDNLGASESALYELFELHAQLCQKQHLIQYSRLYRQATFTFGQLNTETNDAFNWTALVNAILVKCGSAEQFTDNDLVYADVPYLKHFVEIISSTPTRVVRNYVTLQYLLFLGSVKPDEKCMVPSKSEKFQELFNFVYSRMFVDAFVRNTSVNELRWIRSHVTRMVYNLKSSYLEVLLSERTWVNNGTFAKFLNLNFTIGYDDWYLDNQQLDEFYGLVDSEGNAKHLQVVEGNFIASLRTWIRHWVPVKFSKRTGFTMDKLWPIPISLTNAYQHPFKHILIPLGYLVPPLFNLSLPYPINYAIVGSTIAHEIAHIFATETSPVFWNKAQCMFEQYSASVEPNSGLKLKAMRTVKDDIADNAALKAVFGVFRDNRLLFMADMFKSGFDFTNYNKLFFKTYAKPFCNTYNVQKWAALMQSGVHSPHQFRVNMPLANFEPFAKTFKCPIGSPMNPVKKCIIW